MHEELRPEVSGLPSKSSCQERPGLKRRSLAALRIAWIKLCFYFKVHMILLRRTLLRMYIELLGFLLFVVGFLLWLLDDGSES